MTPGHDDLRRAADALASRLPEPLGAVRPPRLQLPLVVDARRRRGLRRHRPGAAGSSAPTTRCACSQEADADAPRRRGRRRRAAGAAAAGARGDAARRPAPARAGRAGHRRAPGRVLLRRVRRARARCPIYSGGLGALAGDILKEASDRALPLVAVGLLYRQGYFRQRIDASGWQHEYWVDTDPERAARRARHRRRRRAAHVTVPIGDVEVVAQVWRVDVGRVPLLPARRRAPRERPASTRWITARLYVGDPDTRLAQYVLLGIGGVRALRRRMGIEPGVVHLNEGHAAFVGARARAPRARAAARASTTRSRPPASARSSPPTRRSRRATTPTPAEQVAGVARRVAAGLGIDPGEIVRLGRTHPDDAGRAVRRHAVRAAHEPRGQRRQSAATARSRARCGTACGRTARSTTCRSRT